MKTLFNALSTMVEPFVILWEINPFLCIMVTVVHTAVMAGLFLIHPIILVVFMIANVVFSIYGVMKFTGVSNVQQSQTYSN